MRRKAKSSQQLEAERVLADARDAHPGNAFVESCIVFYKLRGFLTPKQLEALQNVQDDNGWYDYGDEFDGWGPDDFF